MVARRKNQVRRVGRRMGVSVKKGEGLRAIADEGD